MIFVSVISFNSIIIGKNDYYSFCVIYRSTINLDNNYSIENTIMINGVEYSGITLRKYIENVLEMYKDRLNYIIEEVT